MKGLGKVLILIIILIIGAPIAGGAMALQPDKSAPDYLEDFDYQSFDYETELDSKMQTMLMSNIIGQKSISIDEEFVTKILYKEIQGSNDASGQTISEINNETLSLEKMWVTFDNGVFTLFGLLGYNDRHTTFTVQVLFEDFDGYTEVSLKGIKIGKLPIPKFALTKGIDVLENRDYIKPEDKQLKFGTLDTEDLSLELNDSTINEELHNMLGIDVIVFKELKFDNQKITFHYDFNLETSEGEAINAAINEMKNLVSNEKLRTDLDGKLDSEDEVQQKAKEDINTVLDLLNDKVTTTDTEELTDFTDEDEQAIKDLSESFTKLTPDKQKDVIQVLTDNMDEENKALIETKLSESSTDDTSLEDLLSQFLSGTNTNEPTE